MSKTEIQTRIDAISHRMLDAASDIVETMGQRAALRALARAQVETSLYGEIAALTCRKAACRRARHCRGKPLRCIKRARAEVHALSDGP